MGNANCYKNDWTIPWKLLVSKYLNSLGFIFQNTDDKSSMNNTEVQNDPNSEVCHILNYIS